MPGNGRNIEVHGGHKRYMRPGGGGRQPKRKNIASDFLYLPSSKNSRRWGYEYHRRAQTLKVMLVTFDIKHSAFKSSIRENIIGIMSSYSDVGLGMILTRPLSE